MPRVKLTLQYKGTNYHGWQTQPNGLSVQEVLEKTLSRILNQKIHVVAAGRTDAGVHALGQVCHFDLSDSPIPEKLFLGLNSLLPPDIAIIDVQIVPETFHAQKSVRKKIYDYFIFNSPIHSPFLKDTVWQVPYKLDIARMKQAARLLVGEHDFRAFCASGSSVKTTVRRIYGVKISVGANFMFAHLMGRRQDSPLRMIKISVTGNGFLKQMVRNIVGTLVDVGKGRTTLMQFKKILKSQDRRRAGMTAPAKGLFLRGVIYR